MLHLLSKLSFLMLPTGDSLGAQERLACFQTSKGISELVLRRAACTTLALWPQAGAPGAGGIISVAEAHAAVAQQLAVVSHSVTLALHGGLLTPSVCLWQCITTLQLHSLCLDQTTSSRLQLHRLPRLHTLSLQGCCMAHGYSFRNTAGRQQQQQQQQQQQCSSSQQRSTSVRTLECIGGQSSFCLPFAATNLLDPAKLHTLITDLQLTSVTALMPQLPALQELRNLSQPVQSAADENLTDDNDFQLLLAHPQLARVSLPAMRLECSHAHIPCTWASLELLSGADLASLACMPLTGIQSCTVHGSMAISWFADGDGEAEAALSSISRAEHLVFQADSGTACKWTPAEPSFTLELGSAEQIHAQVLTYTFQHLVPGTALVISLYGVLGPDVVASLAAAPPTLTTLHFEALVDGDEIEVGAEAGVLTHVPDHVSHVVLTMPSIERNHTPEQYLQYFVAGVSRRLRLTLLAAEGYNHWAASGQTMIRAWVAEHASQHVHVDFQCAPYSTWA